MRCFCGCGRRVTISKLGANARGRKTSRLVSQAVKLDLRSGDEHQRAIVFEGRSWQNQYARVVHGELTSDAIRERNVWLTWREGAVLGVAEAQRSGAGH